MPMAGFTRNIPVADTIKVGSHIDRHLDVNGEYWSTAGGEKVHFESGDQLIVIYEVPPENEAKQPISLTSVRRIASSALGIVTIGN